MKSLAVRLTLVGLFLIASGASAYLFWVGESNARVETQAARTFDAQVATAARGMLEIRGAQQAYVAAGQGDEFWTAKVTSSLGSLRDALGALRAVASSPLGQSEIESAMASLDDFERMDRRARDYSRASQKLLASDLIFADGLDMTTAALAAIDRAREGERQALDEAARALRRRQLYALGAGAAAALLAVLLLAPRTADPVESVVSQEPSPVPEDRDDGDDRDGLDLGPAPDEGWSPARREANDPPAAQPAAAFALDLAAVATLCGDLARVVDTLALPAILERTAGILDASGVVLWISDPDARELSPIVTHGYPPQTVSRLGTIPRDAPNATAAAFRTSLVQTVNADSVSNGAIAAPLVTPTGCVGVMAAEVRHAGERDAAKLAAATIVAAQLATLVGPPSTRAHVKAEAARV